MTISGFLLHAQRNDARTLVDRIFGIASCSSAKLFEAGDSDMVCPNTSSANCHSKLILYATGIAVGGAVIGYFIGQRIAKSKARCNHRVKLNTDKVVDTVDIEDIGEKKAYCRCWKSKKFPLCDGSHGAHNKETGDNVGPIIMKGKPEPAQ